MGALILAMVIFGTVGIFRRYLALPSSVIALGRGVIGAVCLALVLLVRRKGLRGLKGHGGWLFVSGAMIGFNWILLFESYNHTTVAAATLCYYMAPVFIMLFSPLVLKEKWTGKKAACMALAFLGMVLVSGVIGGGTGSVRGAALALGAAVLYAGVILINKRLTSVEALLRTTVQIAAASAVLVPYVILTEDAGALSMTPASWGLLLVMGLVHTGLAYVLYFGSLKDLSAHTAAVLSYVDPVVAVLLSALLLHEPMGPIGFLGTVLVLGAAVWGEWPERKA